MGLALLVVCTALLLGGVVAVLRGNGRWAAGCVFAAAVMVAAYLMDVALRVQ